MQLVELDGQIAFLRYLKRVQKRLRHLREARLHLHRGSQIELLLHIAHSLLVGEQALCANANKTIVGSGMLLLDVVDVIGRHKLQAEFLSPGNQPAIHYLLLRNPMVLQLEIEVVRPQRLLEPIDGVTSLVQPSPGDCLAHFTGQTTGQCNDPLLVGR